MAFNITSPIIGAQPIASKSTTQLHNVGEIIKAVDATLGLGEFIYLKGVASTVVGSWVGYNAASLGATVLAVANGKYPLAISMSTNATTTSYGWYQISGLAKGLNITAVTNTGVLSIWLTSTGGSVMSTSVIGDRVFNASLVPLHVVGLTNTFSLARPFVDNAVSLSN
jgi:hypothetical protein